MLYKTINGTRTSMNTFNLRRYENQLKWIKDQNETFQNMDQQRLNIVGRLMDQDDNWLFWALVWN